MLGVAEQVEIEIASRLRVVALLGEDAAEVVMGRAVTAPTIWAGVLADDAAAARVAADLLAVLWPDGVPVGWWGTPLGRRLAGVGHDPGGWCTVREAAALLGWSPARVRREVGTGRLPMRSVLDLLG